MQKNFGFLLFDGFEDLDFVGPWEMLGLWQQQHQGPDNFLVISKDGNHVTSTKGLRCLVDTSIADCPRLDYLLVPGGQGTRTLVHDTAVVDFIREQAEHCEEVLSVCTGAFLLAEAGLLDAKQVTTHWGSLDRLRAYSALKVVEARYVRDGKVWTSAGVSAGIDMALAFIAAKAGEEVAGEIQLYAEYYPSAKQYPKKTTHTPAYVESL